MDTATFWAGGRMAWIRRGPWEGRLLFIYPDAVKPWWTFVVDPSLTPDAPGDHYAEEEDLPVRLVEEWGLEWIPRSDDEHELEVERFNWRRLLRGPSWDAAEPD